MARALRFRKAEREQQNRLMVQKGMWTAFVSYRTALRESGLRIGEAETAARQEFAGRLGLGSGSAEPVPIPSGVGEAPPAKARKPAKHAAGRVTKRDEIDWVAAHINDEPPPEPAEAPNAAAWNLLQFAREKPSDFWKMHVKLLPSKAEIDKEAKLRGDDGRDVIATINRCLAALGRVRNAVLRRDPQRTEPGREPALAP